MANARTIAELLRRHEDQILSEWIRLQQQDLSLRNNLLKAGELEQQCRDFLGAMLTAFESGGTTADVITATIWAPVRDVISGIARSRARQGFTPTETATFVFSLKQPLFALLRRELTSRGARRRDLDAHDAPRPARALHDRDVSEGPRGGHRPPAAGAARAVDAGRRALGRRPRAAADRHARQRAHAGRDGEPAAAIVETGASIAIIDITGVPTVDTLVAQHLLKTVAAARLMGADCIISGIRPQIAQTIVHLGVDLCGRHHQGDARRRLRDRAQAHRARGDAAQAAADAQAAEQAMERIPILKMGEFLLVTIQVDMHDRWR